MKYILVLVLMLMAVNCFAYDFEVVQVGDTVIVKDSGLGDYR